MKFRIIGVTSLKLSSDFLMLHEHDDITTYTRTPAILISSMAALREQLAHYYGNQNYSAKHTNNLRPV